MKLRRCDLVLGLALGLVGLACLGAQAAAQTGHNPFAVAGNEGSASPEGIGGWILAQQTYFYRLLTGAVRAAKQDGSAVWSLAGIGFAYGVLHAAGPGHGKAVVASYMVANERALRRGVAISFLAALLQGCVAIALVAGAAFVLHVTAQRITQAADVIDIAAFAGVALLGAWLLWRKGRAFVAALNEPALAGAGTTAAGPSVQLANLGLAFASGGHGQALAGPVGFVCETVPHHHSHDNDHAGHVHDASCGHFHAPDPATLGDAFSWKTAALTVFSAGSRPCSGAILVLVFALAQGIFLAGIAATFAMSLGTAITTAALAATAVLLKGVAVKLVGGGSRRNELIARGVEVVAALGVLLVGLALLLGVMQAGA
jgi:nickel/cobalt transporter (NicO) family protein